MKTVNIILEGNKDVYFVHEFLLRRFSMFERKSNTIPDTIPKNGVDNPTYLHSSDNSIIVALYSIGGFTNLQNFKNLLYPKADTNGGFSYGIMFDADYPAKGTSGGYRTRLGYLLNTLKQMNILHLDASRSIFLFPNNKDDGDLEVLMERMVSPAPAHLAFLDVCWKNYSECVNRHGFISTTQKSKMNAYTAAFFAGTWDDNGINRSIAEPSLWNWDSHSLDDLYKFIERMINN